MYDRLRSDGTECVWAERTIPPGDSVGHINVISPSSGLVAVLSLRRSVRLRDIRGDLIAVLTTDDLGVERVVVRRLHRTGPGLCADAVR